MAASNREIYASQASHDGWLAFLRCFLRDELDIRVPILHVTIMQDLLSMALVMLEDAGALLRIPDSSAPTK